MTGDIRDDRLAKNESLFREQNEHMEPHNAVHIWVNPAFADWICECADEGCAVPVRLTVAEYEAVRAKPTQFLVAPSEDHVFPDVECIIRRHERYWIVEKLGRAAEVSEKFDPRSRQPNER